jgi:cell division protein FtsN
MAKARRSPSRSKKKSRGILWLVVGLTLGAALMWGTQHYLYRDGQPFRGIAGLFKSQSKATEKKEDKKPQPEAERPPKPKLDFYTILPGETVLPEPRRDDRKTAKAEPPEKGVSYILQAAAYANLEDADRLKAKLALSGLEAHIEKVTVGDKGTHYRVRLGPYSSLDALDAANAKLTQLGIKALRLKLKKGAG